MIEAFHWKHSLQSISFAHHTQLSSQRARSILLVVIVVVLHAGFTPNASGQVIRERVEIRPRPHAQQASVAASPQAGTLRIRFTADRQILLRMFIDTMCDEKGLYETVYYGTGAVEVTFAHPLGSVSVDAQPRVAELARGQSTVVRLEAFYNDQLIYTQSATFSGGGWDIFGWGFTHSIGTPFASAFTLFRQKPVVVEGDVNTFRLDPVYDCSMSTVWNAWDDPVTLTIIGGREYGEFEMGGVSSSTSVTLLASQFSSLRYIPKDSLTSGGVVTVEARRNEISAVQSFQVVPLRALSLQFVNPPSVLQYGDELVLYHVRCVDADGMPIAPPPGVTYTVSITQGARFGHLKRYDDPSANREESVLRDLEPEDDGSVFFYLFATGERPERAEWITVRATASQSAIRAGEATSQLVPSQLLVTARPSVIQFGQRARLEAKERRADGTVVSLPEDDYIYFYISQGVDAGVLVNGDSSQVDDFVDGTWAYADFYAREERPQPDTVRVRIVVWSDHAGYSVVNLLVVRELRHVLDHFAVRVSPDTVEHGTSASITVIAQDASNNEVTIDGNTPLTFTVDKPEYGSIEPVSGVTYAVARAGGVRYLANGTNPLTPQRIGITVAGAGTSGTGSVVVKGTPIRLEVTAERTTVRPLKTGAPNAAALVVRALRGTEPVAGVPVELRVEPVPNSGGHDHHDASRPRGTVSSTSGVTGADGKFTTEYTASEIAGVEEVIVRSPQAGEEVKARIEVKVEGLVAFPQTGNYTLTGMKPAHPNNHYFSQDAVDDLVKAANEFAKAKWNTTGTMRLNDMSLEWGGLFDINGNWKTPHSLHRVGKSVDVENLVMVTIDTVDQQTGKPIRLTIPKVKFVDDFVRFMETKIGNWRFIDEGQAQPDIFKRTRKYPHFEWKGR